ncbi:hypothetical protein SO802_008753 [Lithocarpus litseifolius]|uniref:RNase H type-1 domain-containing protein n=1 Tax=Lithocarpus litseifolius TaxID=425828 RepID=A0AAW2DF44_9ROSI
MLEELFPPLPSASGSYIGENSYVLGSHEFFPEFSQDVMPLLDFRLPAKFLKGVRASLLVLQTICLNVLRRAIVLGSIERQIEASNYLSEYRTAVAQNNPAPSLPPQGVAWSPPRSGHYKINVDGAVFLKQKAAGVGVVIRDEEGRLEAALSKKIHVPLGAIEVEAKAFEMGLLFARDIDVRDVVLEGDSLIVYNALCNFSSPPSSIDTVVQGI